MTVNNKGYIAPTTMLIILLVCLMMFGLFYSKTIVVTKDLNESGKLVNDVVNSNTGLERMYSLLYNNVSYEGSSNFSDINKLYEVQTIEEKFERIVLNSRNNKVKFNINNRTPINIKMTVHPNNDGAYEYSAELIYDGVNLLENADRNVYDSSYSIEEIFSYDKETQITNYGEYVLNIDTVNCNVTVEIEYDNLIERTLLLNNDMVEREIIIKRNDDLKIEYLKGGK